MIDVRFPGPYRVLTLLGSILLGTVSCAQALHGNEPSPTLEPGVLFQCRTLEKPQGDSDVTVVPALALYVSRGQAPTPFLTPGRFAAEWSGYVSTELRGEYLFQVELAGDLKLEVNGQPLALKENAGALRSDLVGLKKGTNSLHATFTAPATKDAFLRIDWIPKGGFPSPIPSQALSHASDAPGLQRGHELRLGRNLFLEYRCARCHLPEKPLLPTAEAAMDGPSFDGIGSRLNASWMAEWIADPKRLRPTARMPRIFHTRSREQSESIAAFLASLKAAGPSVPKSVPAAAADGAAASGDDPKENGKRRFDELHCQSCHNVPGAADSDPARVSLEILGQKYTSGALAEFLMQPDAHFTWTRMPNFKLSRLEATELAAYLLPAPAQPAVAPAPAATPERLAEGRRLVQTSGCLNCHTSSSLENKFTAKPLDALAPNRWDKGCLAASGDEQAPFFGLTSAERAALQRVASFRDALTRETPAEFAARHLQTLRCGECHGKFEGFPSLTAMEGKLKPEWTKAFLAGELSYRPRPWLPARMPAFARHAQSLAAGMAMLHGVPPSTPPEPAHDPAAAAIGQKLVAAQGGLSCISCHAIAKVAATQVFENAGINLAYANARLLKPYFERWVRNPLAIDPVSKMPVFFDEELRSPLTDFYDGDGARQIEALWQYLRLGDKMPPPPGTEPAP